MANYKVVDTEQLEADLTVVADAIRGKGGTTELLSFPNGMKEAVEAIQSGGGVYFPYTVTVGEITPTTNLNEMTIYIGDKKGKKFMFYLMCNEMVHNVVKGSDVGLIVHHLREVDDDSTMLPLIQHRFRRNTSTGVLSSAVSNGSPSVITDDSITLVTYNENHFFRAGYTYKWFCINLDDEV